VLGNLVRGSQGVEGGVFRGGRKAVRGKGEVGGGGEGGEGEEGM